MKITLKEGEEIEIQTENGNSEQYRIIVCYKNCILTKQEFNSLKE